MNSPQRRDAARSHSDEPRESAEGSAFAGNPLSLASNEAARRLRPRRCVAFVIEALTVGGAERMLVSLANGCLESGWEVHVICLTMRGEMADELDRDVSVHVLDKQPGVDARLPARLRALVRRLRPDVLNSHLWVANFWSRASLIGSGVPIVASEHSRDSWKPWHYRLLDRRLGPFTYALVAVSEDTARFYRHDVGVRADLVQVVSNGVQTSQFAECDGRALRTLWAPGGEFLIGTVGRLVGAKNHGRLLDMLACLVAAGLTDVRLVIVGDGPEREALSRQIDALGLGVYVTITGQRDDIPDVMDAFDVFVLSSDREGHPLTALEAQAAGTPVVLTDVGGSAEAIAREEGDPADPRPRLSGGLLVAPEADALAVAVRWFAEQPEQRARMGAFARVHALARFDRDRTVSAYVTLFEAAASDPSNAPPKVSR